MFLVPAFQIVIGFFAFIAGISAHTWIPETQMLFHTLQEWDKRPYVISVLKDICCNDVFAVNSDLDVISRFQLDISHMVILHVHKCGIHIRFGIAVTASET